MAISEEKLEKRAITLNEASEISHLSIYSLYTAIRRGRLKRISKKPTLIDLDELQKYRISKYDPSQRHVNNQLIWDVEFGHLSISHLSKLASWQLGRPYSYLSIFYKVKSGKIRAFLKGRYYVIDHHDAMDFIEKEKASLLQVQKKMS